MEVDTRPPSIPPLESEGSLEPLPEAWRPSLGRYKVGPIKVAPNGLGAAWVRCIVAAAKRAVDAGRIRVGWVSARVDLLPLGNFNVTSVCALATSSRVAAAR